MHCYVIIFITLLFTNILRKTEKWSQAVGMETLMHELPSFEYYPELLIVPETFCQK